MKTERLAAFLDGLVRDRLYSAVVGLVGAVDGVEWRAAAGSARPDPPRAAEPATRFDLASLTKPFVATLALRLDAERLLPLGLPVAKLWPATHPGLARRTLGELLRHRSGLRAWTPLYHRCRFPSAAAELLVADPGLAGARRGTYSDLGYILWGLTAAKASGESLDLLLRRHLLAPLGLDERVEPCPGPAADVAACAAGGAREAELAAAEGIELEPPPPPARGEVQDGNARFFGGLAGHAGLFGDARALWTLGAEWLRPGRVLAPVQVASALAGGGPYALGWARRRVRGSAGPALSPRAFGLTGFTGGSLWIDPERGRILVLLGHRTSPLSDLNPARRRFHRLTLADAG